MGNTDKSHTGDHQHGSHFDIERVVAGKVRFNTRLISENIAVIRNLLPKLSEAAESGDIAAIDAGLKELTNAAIGCRSRLQFVRGARSVLRSYARSTLTEQEVDGVEG